MTRLSKSRPSSSVPSQNCELGPSSSLPWCWTIGSYGEINGAAIAARTSTPRISRPKKPSGLRHVRSKAALSGCGECLSAAASATTARPATMPEADPTAIASGVSDPEARIDQRVSQVHQEVDDDEQQHQQQQTTLNDGVVPVGDAVEHQAPDARPGKDRLDDHGATEQAGELHAEDGDHRQHGITQGMPIHHGGVIQALGPRGADEVVEEHFEQVELDEPTGRPPGTARAWWLAR